MGAKRVRGERTVLGNVTFAHGAASPEGILVRGHVADKSAYPEQRLGSHKYLMHVLNDCEVIVKGISEHNCM